MGPWNVGLVMATPFQPPKPTPTVVSSRWRVAYVQPKPLEQLQKGPLSSADGGPFALRKKKR